MQTPIFDLSLAPALVPNRCYLLLPEQNQGWWEGYVNDLSIIYNMEDLANAIALALDSFGYCFASGKTIKVQPDNGSYYLDVPFKVAVFPNEEGWIRLILSPIKAARETS